MNTSGSTVRGDAKTLSQIFRFGITGGGVTLFDWGITTLLMIWVSLSSAEARGIAIACSLFLSWWGHRIVTFAHSKEAHHKDVSAPFLQILRFILTSSVCVAVNWGGFQLLLNAGVGLGPALFCASAAAALLQFVGCKWFVYRR